MNVSHFFKKKLNIDKITYPLLFCILGLNIIVAILYILYKPLDSDEFQHTHIAWNIFYNNKILYRAFWDHHGVIFPFVNYILFNVFNLSASFSTFYFLRAVSFLYMVAMALLTYLITKKLFKSNFAALLSVAILSSTFFFNLKGVEIRPDVLQNVFWLLGLYLFISNFENIKSNFHILSGIFFGLAVLSNTKAVIGIFFVFVFALLELVVQKPKKKERFFRLIKIILGIIIPHIFIVTYFFLVNGLEAFFQSNYIFNFVIASVDSLPWMFEPYWKIFVSYQFTFLFFSFVGIILLFRSAVKEKNSLFYFVSFITMGCTLSALLGWYSQFYLLFIPLLSIVATYFFIVLIRMSAKYIYLKFVFPLFLLVFFFYPQESFLIYSVENIVYERNDSLLHIVIPNVTISHQKEQTNFILNNTERSDPLSYFWNFCGGFTFNEDAQYYWSYNKLHEDVARILTGVDMFGSKYSKMLEDKKIKYIIATQGELNNLPYSETYQYIINNYQFVADCLLERKNSL